jgi:hypothetical protein
VGVCCCGFMCAVCVGVGVRLCASMFGWLGVVGCVWVYVGVGVGVCGCVYEVVWVCVLCV